MTFSRYDASEMDRRQETGRPTPSAFSLGKPTCLLQGMMRMCEQSLSKEREGNTLGGRRAALGTRGGGVPSPCHQAAFWGLALHGSPAS